MIHGRLPSLPKLVLFVAGMLFVVNWLAEEDTKTGKDKSKSKKKKSKGKNKKSKAEGTDADDEKDVEGEAVVDK